MILYLFALQIFVAKLSQVKHCFDIKSGDAIF